MSDAPNISPTKHVKVVFCVLGCVIVAAAAARWLAYPKTYGEFGHFRGAAIEQAMHIREPAHIDSEKCLDCHKEITKAAWKDVHEKVLCDTCHGPSEKHCDEKNKVAVTRPELPPLRMVTNEVQCLTCHRRLQARPASFPQIDPSEHFKMLHLVDTNTACSNCHDPHQPLFLDKDVQESRLHPVVNKCLDCHKHPQDIKAEKPVDHPILFECAYCHKAIAKDYSTRSHKDLHCDTCHQVYPVSDRAVRVIKHQDPRFCLLCHSDKLKKDAKGPPGIKWPDHLKDVADNYEQDKNKVCIDCHRDAFHLQPSEQEIKDTSAKAKSTEKKQ